MPGGGAMGTGTIVKLVRSAVVRRGSNSTPKATSTRCGAYTSKKGAVRSSNTTVLKLVSVTHALSGQMVRR